MNKNKSTYRSSDYIGLFIISVFCFEVSAVDYSYNLFSSIERSNNLGGFQDSQEGDAYSLGFGFDIESVEQAEWEVDLLGRVQKTRYSIDEFGDEDINELEANLFYKPKGSNFRLAALANVGQTPINRFQVQNINNKRDESTFAVRPSYFFSMTPSDRINIEYTVVKYHLEDVESDQLLINENSSNDYNSILLNYQKDFDKTNQVSINIRKAETDFKDDLELNAIDYDQEDYFLEWVVTGRTNQLQVDLGKSEIINQIDQVSDQELQRISYTRQITSDNQVTFEYSKGISNPIDTNRAANTISINDQTNLAQAQVTTDYSFQYTHTDRLLSGSFRFSDAEANQVFSDGIELRKSAQVALTYLLSDMTNNFSRSNLVINYSKSESDFESPLTTIIFNEIETYSLALNFVYSSDFAISLVHSIRDTIQTDNSLIESQVDSTSTLILFTYRDRGRF